MLSYPVFDPMPAVTPVTLLDLKPLEEWPVDQSSVDSRLPLPALPSDNTLSTDTDLPYPLPDHVVAKYQWRPPAIASLPQAPGPRIDPLSPSVLFNAGAMPKVNVSCPRRPILEDLLARGIPNDIAYCANTICVDKMPLLTTARRADKHKQLMFYCTYCAYNELGIYVDEIKLAARFDLDAAGARAAITDYDVSQTGYSPPVGQYSPLDPIPDYCRDLGFDDTTARAIVEASRCIMAKAAQLNLHDNKVLAVAFIYYYYISRGIDYLHQLAYFSGFTTATIRKVAHLVTVDDNR